MAPYLFFLSPFFYLRHCTLQSFNLFCWAELVSADPYSSATDRTVPESNATLSSTPSDSLTTNIKDVISLNYVLFICTHTHTHTHTHTT